MPNVNTSGRSTTGPNSPAGRRPKQRAADTRRRKAVAALAAASALAAQGAAGAYGGTLYWDGGTTTITGTSDGASQGGAGTWGPSVANWDPGYGVAHVGWPGAGNAAAFGGTAGAVTVDVGGVSADVLQYVTTGYSFNGGAVTLSAGGTNVSANSGTTTTVNSVVAGSNGLGLTGGGTLVLRAADTYTGDTSISLGSTLSLNFSTGSTATDIVSNLSGLVLNNGTLLVTGKAAATDSQTFAGTTINGAGVITLTQNSATSLTTNLGALTRNTGRTLQFTTTPNTTTNVATTTTTNTNGILGTWAVVSTGTGLKYATVNGSGQVVGLTGTTAADANALTDTTGAVNYELTAAGSAPASFSGNTIRYNGATGTLAPGATLFQLNGLINATANTLTIGTNDVSMGANNELVIVPGGGTIAFTGTIKNNGATAGALTVGGAAPAPCPSARRPATPA